MRREKQRGRQVPCISSPPFFVLLRWGGIPRTVKCSIWYPVVLCSSAPSLPLCGSQLGLVSWIQRLCLEASWATATKDTGGVQWELTLSSVVQILSCFSTIQLQPKHPSFPAPRHWCLLSADRQLSWRELKGQIHKATSAPEKRSPETGKNFSSACGWVIRKGPH